MNRRAPRTQQYVPTYVPIWYGQFLKKRENSIAGVRRLEGEFSLIENKIAVIPRNVAAPIINLRLNQETIYPLEDSALPIELLGEISRRSDLRTTLNLSQVSRATRELINSDRYWIDRITDEFPDQAQYLDTFKLSQSDYNKYIKGVNVSTARIAAERGVPHVDRPELKDLSYPVIYRLLRDYDFGTFSYIEKDEDNDENENENEEEEGEMIDVFTATLPSVIAALKRNDTTMVDYILANKFFKWYHLISKNVRFGDILEVLAFVALEAGAFDAYNKIYNYIRDAEDFEEPDYLSGDIVGDLGWKAMEYVTSDINILRKAFDKFPQEEFEMYLHGDDEETEEDSRLLVALKLAIKSNAPDVVARLATYFPLTVERFYQEVKQSYEVMKAGLNK